MIYEPQLMSFLLTASKCVTQVMDANSSQTSLASRALPSSVFHGTDVFAAVRKHPKRMQTTLCLDN
jgi:S-adenosylmethionine hydrolase